jgi:hypothetical protein
MNRHQRRAAKTEGVDKKLDPIIAIHEAGHVVARVLSAEDFGLPAEKMISYIEVGTRQNMGVSHFDKSVTLTSQAVTYGPTLSAELQAVFNRVAKDIEPNKLTEQHIIDAVRLHAEGWLADDQFAGGNAGRHQSHPSCGSNLDEQRPTLGCSGRWHPKLFRTAGRFHPLIEAWKAAR